MASPLSAFLERRTRVVPWILNGIVLSAIGASLGVTIPPLYRYVVARETERAKGTSAALGAQVRELLSRAGIVADMAALDVGLVDLVKESLAPDASPRTLRKLHGRLGEWEKALELSLIEIVKPDGTVLVSSGVVEGRAESHVSDWIPFQGTDEVKGVTSLTRIGDRVFAASSANLRSEGSVVAVAIAAYELHGDRLSEWARSLSSDLSLAVDGKTVFSTHSALQKEGAAQIFSPTSEGIVDIGGAPFATTLKALESEGRDGKKVELGKIQVASPLSGFFESLKTIGKTATLVLVPIALLAVAGIFLLGHQLVAFTLSLRDMTRRLRQLLEGTKELAASRTVPQALQCAVRHLEEGSPLVTEPVRYVECHAEGAASCLDVRKESVSPGLFGGESNRVCEEILRGEDRVTVTRDGQVSVPVFKQENAAGRLLIPSEGRELLPEECDFFQAMASSLGISIDNIRHTEALAAQARLEADMAVAKAVQEALIPQRDLVLPAVDIATHMEPADQTGGDWFGYHFDKSGNRLFVFVGDVTGHGIPSALVTGVVAGSVFCGERLADRISREEEKVTLRRVRNLAHTLNDVVLETGSRAQRLLTMAFLAIDLESGEVSFLNAGHLPVIWKNSAQGSIQHLVAPGSRLGYTDAPEFGERSWKLSPGDLVVLYTDGLVENTGENRELISPKEVGKLVGGQESAAGVRDAMVSRAKMVWGRKAMDDDFSVVAIQWKGMA